MSEENVDPARGGSPGWYLHPDRGDEEWYWDGESWTESRPRSAAPLGTGKPTGWVVAGYISAVVLPLVGFIIGFVPLRNRDSPHWKPVVWISIAMILLPLALVMLLSL